MAQRILILGGGFAGMATARTLERILRPEEAEISVVSRENFSLFTPMLPEVGSGNLETRHVVTPVRAQLKRSAFVLADVYRIDLIAKTVDVRHTIEGAEQTLHYDQLVFALGGVTSTFGLPGIAERSFPYKTLEDADRLRNHVIAMLELADVTHDPAERKRMLTFVFVGGGFTGVEAAGEMADFFHSIVRFYPSIGTRDIEICLVEGGTKLLTGSASRHGRVQRESAYATRRERHARNDGRGRRCARAATQERRNDRNARRSCGAPE